MEQALVAAFAIVFYGSLAWWAWRHRESLLVWLKIVLGVAALTGGIYLAASVAWLGWLALFIGFICLMDHLFPGQ